MSVTPLHPQRDRWADHNAGLIYLDRLGPVLPTLNASGLGYIRDDLLARAAGAEAQANANPENFTLVVACEAQARVLREAAHQIVTYALNGWGVTE